MPGDSYIQGQQILEAVACYRQEVIGGLPEIPTSAEAILYAIQRTEDDIREAELPIHLSHEPIAIPQDEKGDAVSPSGLLLRLAFEEEGEVGVERRKMLTELEQIQSQAADAISRLIALRNKLKDLQEDT